MKDLKQYGMLVCPDCNHLLSDTATICPICNYTPETALIVRYNNLDLSRIIKRTIIEALKYNNGHMKKTASTLNISLRALYNKCEKHNIKPEIFRTADGNWANQFTQQLE